MGFGFHLNFSGVRYIVIGVAQIVLQHLLQHKLVSPHPKLLRGGKRHLAVMIFSQDRGGLHHAADHFHKVKVLQSQLHLAGFNLSQVQQTFDDVIHLFRLVNDHVAVKVPALRVVVDIILQSFGLALNQSNRRFQLMGDI